MAAEQLVPPEIAALLNNFGISIFTFMLLASLIMIWSLLWKGLALWKSARLKQPVWFVLLLVINTLGILEILYIFVFSKSLSRKKEEHLKKKFSRKR